MQKLLFLVVAFGFGIAVQESQAFKLKLPPQSDATPPAPTPPPAPTVPDNKAKPTDARGAATNAAGATANPTLFDKKYPAYKVALNYATSYLNLTQTAASTNSALNTSGPVFMNFDLVAQVELTPEMIAALSVGYIPLSAVAGTLTDQAGNAFTQASATATMLPIKALYGYCFSFGGNKKVCPAINLGMDNFLYYQFNSARAVTLSKMSDFTTGIQVNSEFVLNETLTSHIVLGYDYFGLKGTTNGNAINSATKLFALIDLEFPVYKRFSGVVGFGFEGRSLKYTSAADTYTASNSNYSGRLGIKYDFSK